jgi:3-oxoacyl-[acyl-carrier protein] reductase
MRTDRVVLITGAAGGIGTVLVDRFLAEGDMVIGTDIGQDRLERWRKHWPNESRLSAVAADVTTEEDIRQLAQTIRDQAGRVDVLVNAAGYFPVAPFEEMTLQQWRQVVDANLTSVYLVTQAVLPLMKGRGWGRVINFGSGAVLAGPPEQTHYVAAKAGIVGLSHSLARALGGEGITVNVIAPGMTLTQAVRETFPAELIELVRDARAIARDQVPEDLAGPVVFLASPDADFVTGQTINVDGGNFLT